MAERCAFEHEVRRYPKMPSLWVDFVSQNKAAESSLARLNIRRSYEAGRRDATEAANEGWTPQANAASPVRAETFDPIAMMAQRLRESGVLIEAGAPFFPRMDKPCRHFRMAYSSIARDRIAPGVALTAACAEDLIRD